MTPRNVTTIVLAAALAAAMGFMAGPARAETVKPLSAMDCDEVRRALEDGLPFGPGFRRMEVEFPENDRDIRGQVCRLLTLGTGVHMEGPEIRSLKAMGRLVQGSLTARGWTENAETAKFSEKSAQGRQVFALKKDQAICVTTVVIAMVEGIAPLVEAYEDGKVRLGRLKPHEREWWVSVDCFGLPGAVAVSTETVPVRPKPQAGPMN